MGYGQSVKAVADVAPARRVEGGVRGITSWGGMLRGLVRGSRRAPRGGSNSLLGGVL
jgi:hypothetical protein